MIFKKTNFDGVFIITTQPKEDERGSFLRIYAKDEFGKNNIDFEIKHINRVFTLKKGTIRGIHMQRRPYEEAKLISCIQGSIFDVIIDLRKKSKTFGKLFSTILDSKNKKMLLMPKGFAHGYQTLEGKTIIEYPTTEYYSSQGEIGIRWNDPSFKIKWPLKNIIVSKKDTSWPDFKFFGK